jgi:TolB-like protein/tRNA A-37 threonylcarbamoyl transferase component Bud32
MRQLPGDSIIRTGAKMGSELPLGTRIGARYEVREVLGHGGSATVYRAYDSHLTRDVAVKLLHLELSEAVSADRFVHEIALTSRLQHPHILAVLDSGRWEGRLYYVMPFVAGETLEQRLRRKRQLPLDVVVKIAREVGDALSFAHSFDVIHRDVKPSNILLATDHAWLCDFGIARAIRDGDGERLTTSGVIVGTVAYMSPEQASGDRNIDSRSDIYSFGCVLYESLAGVRPFVGADEARSLALRMVSDPPPLSLHRPALAPQVAAAVMRSMERSPADRFATAGEFAGALAAAAAGTTLGGDAGSRAADSRRPVGARRLLLIAAMLIGVCTLGVGGWWMAARRDPSPPAFPDRKMLAVLPFENLGGPNDEYFADGVTEEITSRLASIRSLGVISRTSARQYRNTAKPLKEVARELGVDYVLEGSVRWEKAQNGPGRVRVTPQLIRVSDDSHMWANHYDAEAADIFDVQTRVAEAVAGALGVALGAPERRALAERPTESFEAHTYDLQGHALLENMVATASAPGEFHSQASRAAGLFERALAIDSAFVEAYLGLADAHSILMDSLHDTHDRARRRAIDRARLLAPESSEVLSKMSVVALMDRDTTRARELLERILQRDPNDSEAWASLSMQQWYAKEWSPALASIARSVVLDPRSVASAQMAFSLHFYARRFAEAERYLERVATLRPNEPGPFLSRALLVVASAGDTARAGQLYQDAIRRFGLDSVARLGGGWLFIQSLDSAQVEALRGRRPSIFGSDSAAYYRFKADLYRALRRPAIEHAYRDSQRVALERRTPAAATGLNASDHLASLANVYAQLGRRDDALRAARRATEVQADFAAAWQLDPSPDWLRYKLARVHARLGEGDVVAPELEYLMSVPSDANKWILRLDPAFEPIRSTPRIQRLLK